jgi:hypothetical protein
MPTKLEQEIIDIQLDCAKRVTDAIRRALFGWTLPTVEKKSKPIKSTKTDTKQQRTADRLRRMLQSGGWASASAIRGTLNVSDKVFRNARKIADVEQRGFGALAEYRLKAKKR